MQSLRAKYGTSVVLNVGHEQGRMNAFPKKRGQPRNVTLGPYQVLGKVLGIATFASSCPESGSEDGRAADRELQFFFGDNSSVKRRSRWQTCKTRCGPSPRYGTRQVRIDFHQHPPGSTKKRAGTSFFSLFAFFWFSFSPQFVVFFFFECSEQFLCLLTEKKDLLFAAELASHTYKPPQITSPNDKPPKSPFKLFGDYSELVSEWCK